MSGCGGVEMGFLSMPSLLKAQNGSEIQQKLAVWLLYG